jgi:hypothetical protein
MEGQVKDDSLLSNRCQRVSDSLVGYSRGIRRLKMKRAMRPPKWATQKNTKAFLRCDGIRKEVRVCLTRGRFLGIGNRN